MKARVFPAKMVKGPEQMMTAMAHVEPDSVNPEAALYSAMVFPSMQLTVKVQHYFAVIKVMWFQKV